MYYLFLNIFLKSCIQVRVFTFTFIRDKPITFVSLNVLVGFVVKEMLALYKKQDVFLLFQLSERVCIRSALLFFLNIWKNSPVKPNVAGLGFVRRL